MPKKADWKGLGFKLFSRKKVRIESVKEIVTLTVGDTLSVALPDGGVEGGT